MLEVARRLPALGVDVVVITSDSGPRAASARCRRGRAGGARASVATRARSPYRSRSPGGYPCCCGRSCPRPVLPHADRAGCHGHRTQVQAAVRRDFHGGGHSSPIRSRIRPAQIIALRYLLRRSEYLIATARFEIEHYGRLLGLGAEHFVHLPNGSELPALARAAEVDPHLIVSLGRLERYKGFPTQRHRGLPYVLADDPNARLWIAGSGPYEPELRSLALRLDVADRVEIREVPGVERARYAEEIERTRLAVLPERLRDPPAGCDRGRSARRPARGHRGAVGLRNSCAMDSPIGFRRAPMRGRWRVQSSARSRSPLSAVAEIADMGRLRRQSGRSLPCDRAHSRMRILMISQFYPPIVGGEESLVQDLSRSLAGRGHDVAVATIRHGDSPAIERNGSLTIYRFTPTTARLSALYGEDRRRHAPPIPDPEGSLALRRIIALQQPDVIHAHNWLAHSLVPLTWFDDRPLVHSLHDYSLICATKRLMHFGRNCSGPAIAKVHALLREPLRKDPGPSGVPRPLAFDARPQTGGRPVLAGIASRRTAERVAHRRGAVRDRPELPPRRFVSPRIAAVVRAERFASRRIHPLRR